MPSSSKSRPQRIVEFVAASIPWILAMYTFYWLDSSGTWTAETPHRGKLSVVILGAGMALSFLLWSWISTRQRK